MIKRIGLPETEECRAPVADAQGFDWLADDGPDMPAALSQLGPISLAEMAGVALMDRTETKFVLHERSLPELLAGLVDEYRVLDINGNRMNHYRTLYFDTDDYALYRRHQAGGRNRYKVRSRSYVDTDLSFLEVKHKVNARRTVKNRVATPGFMDCLTLMTSDFLGEYLPLPQMALLPKLWNEYTRVTLVSRNEPERVTLDLNLQFRQNGQTMILPGLVIAEVKKNGPDHESAFIRHMRALSIRPTGFSKYCIGVSMLDAGVKHNSFKPQLRMVTDLIQTGGYYVN